MPRHLRLGYPGAICHVMTLGDHREDIFLDDKDRQPFLYTLGQACQRTVWQRIRGFGPPPAPGNHHEPEMDRVAATDGPLDFRFQLAAKISLAVEHLFPSGLLPGFSPRSSRPRPPQRRGDQGSAVSMPFPHQRKSALSVVKIPRPRSSPRPHDFVQHDFVNPRHPQLNFPAPRIRGNSRNSRIPLLDPFYSPSEPLREEGATSAPAAATT
jgi:hypothetical protein